MNCVRKQFFFEFFFEWFYLERAVASGRNKIGKGKDLMGKGPLMSRSHLFVGHYVASWAIASARMKEVQVSLLRLLGIFQGKLGRVETLWSFVIQYEYQ